MKTALTSVGIDIGTTTTHMVVSRLYLENQASATRIPEMAIREREILHQSEIYLTPHKDGAIDGSGVANILSQFYQAHNLESKDIDTGAVLITGESARARNAAQVIDAIAKLAGEFVVESAGPLLESALAARGSGAVEYSQQTGKTIVNIDIGGGTTNIAQICAGKIIKTLGIKIGGRCLKLAHHDGLYRIVSKAPGALTALKKLGLDTACDLSTGQVDEICRELVAALRIALGVDDIDDLDDVEQNELLQWLSLSENPLSAKDLLVSKDADEYWISGGVAALMDRDQAERKNQTAYDTLPFGDLGLLLGDALRDDTTSWTVPVKVVESAIRATVIGAGMHSLQISGCTIEASAQILPLKNIRLINVSVEGDLQSNIRSAFETLGVDQSDRNRLYAIVLADLIVDDLNYQRVKTLCFDLAAALARLQTLIIITKIDIAMSLSQILKGLIPNKRIITVDGIDVQDGDYLDIGRPLSDGGAISATAIPVVVKTLLFYK